MQIGHTSPSVFFMEARATCFLRDKLCFRELMNSVSSWHCFESIWSSYSAGRTGFGFRCLPKLNSRSNGPGSLADSLGRSIPWSWALSILKIVSGCPGLDEASGHWLSIDAGFFPYFLSAEFTRTLLGTSSSVFCLFAQASRLSKSKSSGSESSCLMNCAPKMGSGSRGLLTCADCCSDTFSGASFRCLQS